MTTEQPEPSSPAVKSIWNRLLGNVRKPKKDGEDPLTASAVERQTENSRKGGTIWEAVLKANEEAMIQLVHADPTNVDQRGPVGECPIHMLFLYGSDTHLKMGQYLIKHFPHVITQIYNQAVNKTNNFLFYWKKKWSFCFFQEYYGENVLHIAIIKRNATMVEWLLGDENNQAYQDDLLTAAASGNFFKL